MEFGRRLWRSRARAFLKFLFAFCLKNRYGYFAKFIKEINEIHTQITEHLGEIDKYRKRSRKFQAGLLVLNAITLGTFLLNPRNN